MSVLTPKSRGRLVGWEERVTTSIWSGVVIWGVRTCCMLVWGGIRVVGYVRVLLCGKEVVVVDMTKTDMGGPTSSSIIKTTEMIGKLRFQGIKTKFDIV